MNQQIGLLKRLWRQALVQNDERKTDRWNRRKTENLISTNSVGTLFSYIVVTPHVVHLAPLAALNCGNLVQPVFVLNGVSQSDTAWLNHICPNIPVLHFQLSFLHRGPNILSHGRVIETLADAHHKSDFCIQDADCFVTASNFWEAMTANIERNSAAGPFLNSLNDPPYPETPLLKLNGKLISKVSRKYGVDVKFTKRANRKAGKILHKAGYPIGRYLEPKKDYFDALHQYWVVTRHLGYEFLHVDGAHKEVFHIGGTSYLFDRFENLETADHWAINAHYFHLRLLELPACSRFLERFSKLTSFHQSSDAILKTYPNYASCWRRRLSDQVLDALNVNEVFS